MDRQDTSISEEVRRKRLAAMANAQNPTSSEAALGGPSNATSGAGSQLNSANSEMVVATASSSSTSANGTVVNNSYMLIDTEQLKNVVSSVLPGIVEAVVSKVKLPSPAASTSAQGASGSDVVDISELVTSGEEASNSNNNRGSGTRARSQPFSGSASTPMPGPSRTRHPAPLALPCGVQARQVIAARRSQEQNRSLPHYSSTAGALCRSGDCLNLGTSNLPMNFVWGNTVERLVNWREYPVNVKRRKERDLGASDLDTVLEFVTTVVGALNTSLKKKKVNEKKVSCSICCDNSITHMLPCRHCFCEPCILQFMVNDDLCPLCRKKFSKYHELLR